MQNSSAATSYLNSKNTTALTSPKLGLRCLLFGRQDKFRIFVEQCRSVVEGSKRWLSRRYSEVIVDNWRPLKIQEIQEANDAGIFTSTPADLLFSLFRTTFLLSMPGSWKSTT
eukprot:scaffold3572_cov93-Skeletonema_dohrnii-CCMP3373.AAC.1